MSGDYIPASLRRLVWKRARECCEYCLLPATAILAAHEVDHIVAEKHGGKATEANLALSCARCNKHKGSDLTTIDRETKALVVLLNPRQDRWDDHFSIEGTRIAARTAVGRATIALLQLNHKSRVAVREYLLQAGEWPPSQGPYS